MARTNDPDPDPARARLATLATGPPGPVRATTRPDGAVPLAPEADRRAGGRDGWPTAPAGTPAARLRRTGIEASRVALDGLDAMPDAVSTGPPDDPWGGSGRPWGPRGAAGVGEDTGAGGGGGDRWGDPWGGDSWAGDDADHASEDETDVAHWSRGVGESGHERWGGQAAGRWTERWLPASWRQARWDPGRAGSVALAAVAAVAAVVAAVGVWSGRPSAEPVPTLPSVTGPGPASSIAPPAPAGGPIVVSVSGKVARPGLVRLPEGSRVGEAVAAAGGAAPGVDLTGLNLAQRLADGEQVSVGVPPAGPPNPPAAIGAPVPSGGGGRAGAAAPGDKVDLNSATLEQLDGLPGVGPVTAQKIIDWRTQHGRFASVDQLQEVGGIGPARLNTLRARVTV